MGWRLKLSADESGRITDSVVPLRDPGCEDQVPVPSPVQSPPSMTNGQ